MAFPTTAILDNFDRSNENPLSQGGNWTMLDGAWKVLTNQCKVSSLGGDTFVGARYSAGAITSNNGEVYCTILDASKDIWVYMVSADYNGYGAEIRNGTQYIIRETDFADTVIGTYNASVSNNDVVGLERVGNILKIYVNGVDITSGGVNDATHDLTGATYMLWAMNTAAGIDNFGGGTYVPPAGAVFFSGTSASLSLLGVGR